MKKSARLVSLITCITIILAINALPAQGQEVAIPNALFETIPGVTPTDIDRINQIRQAHPEGLVYGMLPSDESFINEFGEIGGFTRLMCKRLGELFGIDFIPQVLSWDDLVEGLDNGSVHITGELTSTPERQDKYYFSSPISERGFTVYRHASNPELDLINGGGRYRYGFLQGVVTYDRVLASSEIPFEPVFLQNYQEGAEAMRSGRVDAVICETLMDSAFEYFPDIAYQ